MGRILVGFWVGVVLFVGNAFPSGLPITNSAVLNSIVLDGDNPTRVEYLRSAGRDTLQQGYYWNIAYFLRPYGTVRLLRGGSGKAVFQSGEMIRSNSVVYRNAGLSFDLGITGFSQNETFTGEFFYNAISVPPDATVFTNQVRALVGFRYEGEDGTHFGWLKFSRADTVFTTPFELEEYDWNPIPGASIRAGLPPEIPVASEIITDGEGKPALRLSWHPAVATWILEMTPDLTPPVQWTEQVSSGTWVELPVEDGAPQRYYRLRRPD